MKKQDKKRIDREADGKQEYDYGNEELEKQPALSVKHLNQDEESEGKRHMANGGSHDADTRVAEKKEKDEDDKKKSKKDKKIGPGGHVRDETGPHGRGMGPGEGEKECVGKSIVERWEELKKKLSSEEAIMDLEEAQEIEEVKDDENADGKVGAAPPEGNSQGQELPLEENGEQELSLEEAEDQGNSEEQLIQILRDEGLSDEEIAHVVHGHAEPQVDPVDQSKIDMNNAKMEVDKAAAERDAAVKDKEAESNAQHQQRMNDLEYDSAKIKSQVSQIDNDHKKRMLDLEYDKANKLKDLEVEYKKKELELKLDNRKKAAQDSDARTTKKPSNLKKAESNPSQYATPDKLTEEEILAALRQDMMAELDAINLYEAHLKATDNKKLKNVLQHIIDEEKEHFLELKELLDERDLDDKTNMSKSDWKYNEATGNFNHPEHGSIAIQQDKGMYQVKHNGRIISTHIGKDKAITGAAGHMKDLRRNLIIANKKEKDEEDDVAVSVERPDVSTPQSDLPHYGYSKNEEE